MRKNEYISLSYVSATFSIASVELILFFCLHFWTNEYPLFIMSGLVASKMPKRNDTVGTAKCTSKCADDVNFQSFLIVLKGNRKKFNDFDIASKLSQTFQKIWEKLIIFCYLVSYVAFAIINVCSVRLQIHKYPVILLFYFIF